MSANALSCIVRTFPQNSTAPQLILAAVLCGLILGIEREIKEKPAGLRTLILVSTGSATFTLNSFFFVPINGDSGRVAAQIVAGIGFLGAGAPPPPVSRALLLLTCVRAFFSFPLG